MGITSRIRNYRNIKWQCYQNQNYSEEMLSVREWKDKRIIEYCKPIVPPKSGYEKWILVNEPQQLAKRSLGKISFQVLLIGASSTLAAACKKALSIWAYPKTTFTTSLEELKESRDSYVVVINCDLVIPAGNLLHRMAEYLEASPVDFLYADEDLCIEGDGAAQHRSDPYFKPDWSPDTYNAFPYVGELYTVRADLAKEMVKAYQEQRLDQALTGKTVGHLPQVLSHRYETYPWTENAETTAFGERYSETDFSIADASESEKCISLVMPSKDNPHLIRKCLHSLEEFGMMALIFEIIVVDNGSSPDNRTQIEEILAKYGAKYIYKPMEFNFSAMCNMGAAQATGDYLWFLNDDVEAFEEGALQKMLDHAKKPHAGAVGAKLYYPDGKKIQHCGVISYGVGPGHCLVTMEDDKDYYFGRNTKDVNVLAVTAACLLVRKSSFEEVGGFDEELTVAYNDVALCFSLEKAGFYQIQCNKARFYHHESITRGYDEGNSAKQERLNKEKEILYKKYPEYAGHDPFYNPNLSPCLPNFEWNVDDYGRADAPWGMPSKVADFRWDIRGEWIREDFRLQLDEIKSDEKQIHLEGWAYMEGEVNASYIRKMLFRQIAEAPDGSAKAGRTFAVGTRSRYKGYLKEQFPEVEGMEMLSFTCDVSGADLPDGRYRLGMVAEEKNDGRIFVIFTDKEVEVTKNG